MTGGESEGRLGLSLSGRRSSRFGIVFIQLGLFCLSLEELFAFLEEKGSQDERVGDVEKMQCGEVILPWLSGPLWKIS